MANSVTVTSNQSWGSRLGDSIKSVLFGLVLFVAAFPVLFWNESRSVRTARSLSEGLGAVVDVQPDAVAAGNEGKLVHVSGAVDSGEEISDEEWNVTAKAVKLIRTVEMYQWKESEKSESRKKLGGGTETVKTYTYSKEWSDSLIDSSQFQETEGHENPGAFPVESQTLTADPVKVGAFTLSAEQLDQLTNATDLKVDAAAADQLPDEVRDKVKVAEGRYYMGANPAAPIVGDARISFSTVNPSQVSLVGVQTGETFAPYQAKAGDTVLLVEEGMQTAAQMFKTAQDKNAVLTWILRAVGFFMFFLGTFLVFRPLAVFADVLPLFGTMLGAGIGFFAFLIAVVFSSLTIAIAWIFVRPVLGITLLVLAAAAIFWLIRRGRAKKAQRAGVTPPPLSSIPSPPPA
ncbi:MAG TPA: TMEM43 family protein [Thermoanaerobaculia bacterium]|nr:TMEM43 family protein [Thermoanaerobaculia bacterium]